MTDLLTFLLHYPSLTTPAANRTLGRGQSAPVGSHGRGGVPPQESVDHLVETPDSVMALDIDRIAAQQERAELSSFGLGVELVDTVIDLTVRTIVEPSLINLDYADLTLILKDGSLTVCTGTLERSDSIKNSRYRRWR